MVQFDFYILSPGKYNSFYSAYQALPEIKKGISDTSACIFQIPFSCKSIKKWNAVSQSTASNSYRHEELYKEKVSFKRFI